MFFFFKQKTAYEMRISDWSSDVCSSDLWMSRDTRLSDVLHVLLHMDQLEGPLTSEVLARSMGTNPAVFRRTMAGLREAGFVKSDKGHGGGWRLARPLRDITLLAVDGIGRASGRESGGKCV